MHNTHPTARSAVRGTAALLLLVGLAGCADSLRPLGSSPSAARDRAAQLFDAFVTRFSPNDLSSRYERNRLRLAQAALVPSRVFDDSTVWDARPNDNTRLLLAAGTGAAGRYRIETRPSLAPPSRPGDTRHAVTLERLPDSGYRWKTRVDLALGAVTAEEVSLLTTALVRAPEGRTERELRADYTASFPRATAAFGRGFTIDSLRVTPTAVGATTVAITASFRPALMREQYPHLADYIDKYLRPAKYRLSLTEPGGAPLLEIAGRDRAMTIRYRIQRGTLMTLYGPPRPWPDTIQLIADVSLKVKLFTVGFHDLVTDFVISNTGSDRAWTVIAQHEPDWDLPFITERLIRSPLRRPFSGEGAMFRLAVRDSAGEQTLLSRQARLEVQESAIMRFLGGLAAHALGELDAEVEAEENRFIHDGFAALRTDLQGLADRWQDP